MNPTENLQEPTITHQSQKKPFVLRIIGLATMVMGFIGSLFFASVILYQITDADFALRFKYSYHSVDVFRIYLGSGLLLHFSLLISGVLIFRLKKKSLWVFSVTTAGLLLVSLMLEQKLLWPEVILTFLFFIILFSYRKKLN